MEQEELKKKMRFWDQWSQEECKQIADSVLDLAAQLEAVNSEAVKLLREYMESPADVGWDPELQLTWELKVYQYLNGLDAAMRVDNEQKEA